MQQTLAQFQAAKHPGGLPVHSQGPHLDPQLPCRQEVPPNSNPQGSAIQTKCAKAQILFPSTDSPMICDVILYKYRNAVHCVLYCTLLISYQLPLFDQNPSSPPPSTGSVTPVIKLAALLARNTTGAAISSGSATRPRG